VQRDRGTLIVGEREDGTANALAILGAGEQPIGCRGGRDPIGIAIVGEPHAGRA
jgi:hypothetical protein